MEPVFQKHLSKKCGASRLLLRFSWNPEEAVQVTYPDFLENTMWASSVFL